MIRFLLSIGLILYCGVTLADPPASVVSHWSSENIQPSQYDQRSTINDQRTKVGLLIGEINRTAFYKALEENNKELVNAQLKELETSPPGIIRDAFMGTMLMKKAGFGAPPALKLKLFKQGRKMLETAIREKPDNAEFRFFRLIVQEHAPGALGYHNDIQGDSEYIRKSYKSLPDEVQHAIANYNKKSKYLKLEVS